MSGGESDEKSISLREWTERALATADISTALANESFVSAFGANSSSWPADIRRTLALTSDSYLSSALKVARLLADQICNAKEGDYDVGHGEERKKLLLPMPGTDWADRVAIYLSNEHQNIDIDGDELKDMLNYTEEDEAVLNSLMPGKVHFGNEKIGELSGNYSQLVDIASHEHVARAEIFTSPMDNSNGCPRNKMQCIYSLGIVFYHLFSGGERPDEIIPQIRIENQPLDEGADVEADSDGIETGKFFDLDGELNILDDELNDADQMPNKKKGPQKMYSGMRSVSVEPLKLRGLPASLCNLIGNMIDCINGDLSGEEAYQNISDVRIDLQLMSEKPHRFLYDMDFDKLSVTGLQLNEAVFGRDADFPALKDSYRRSISGQNELGIVAGPSGVGKSVLANRLGSFVTATGGLFLSGKFDQLDQNKPFSALASAFNEYCDKMFKEGRSNLQEVATRLRIALGGDARHLVKVIPNLSVILGDCSGQQEEDNDCVDAQKRLQYLLCQFVDVISGFSGAPITLFLDDLQWSDQASINAINKLLRISGSLNTKRQFFFLGSSREEGILEGHPFGSMLSSIRQFGVNATIVQLVCMDKETTNTLVSDLLCLSPRLTRSLSEIIHHKVKGNMLFFSQLMISLCKEGLVCLSLSRRRWVWDEKRIQERKLPDDVATFLTSTVINILPKEVQDALCTLSCFGACSDCALIKVLETCGSPMIELLDIAVAEGILDKINDSYSFCHDRLQEAAYGLMKPEERCLFHFKYGVALVPRALDLKNDSLLFTAASQINRAGPAVVKDVEQSLLIANLNLTAGHKAIEMSDYSSAYSFFDNGISFLRKRHWQEHYDLSLALFDAASKCALVLGDLTILTLLSEQVIQYAQSFDDTLNSVYNIVSALAYTSQLPQSVERSIIVLSQLGEEIPESYSEPEIMRLIEQTKAMLQGFTDRQLIEYRTMDDPSMIMAQKFYARLELSVQMIRPAAQPNVTLKMVQHSIAHGVSPVSPIGFVYFGQLLARLGHIKEGCRYVKIAREMLDRLGSKEVAGEVIVTETQILLFVEPLQVTFDFHVKGEEAAMAAGDIHSALLNRAFFVVCSFWASTKLPVCKKQFEHARRLMEEHNHLTWLAHIIQVEKNISLLMNSAEDSTGQAASSDSNQAQDLKAANPHVEFTFCFQKMYIRFMLREFEETKALAEKYFDFNLHTWSLFYIHTCHAFFGGLVSFWVYRQSNDTQWCQRGQKAKAAMKKWAESSRHNFQHKSYLLEAEDAYSNKYYEKANSLYEKAVSATKQHRFVNDEALTCELAGYFFLDIAEKDKALQFFMQAHEKYHEWGAIAKSNALFEFVQQVIGGPEILSNHVSASLSPDPNDHNGNVNRRKRESK